MNESLAVGFRESGRQLNAETKDFFGRKGPGRKLCVQGDSGYVLGDEEVEAILIAEFKNRGDVRVVKPGEGQGFFAKTPARSFIGEQALRKHLESDFTFELLVIGLVDDAHPTCADLVKNAVVGNCLANHYRNPIARPRKFMSAEFRGQSCRDSTCFADRRAHPWPWLKRFRNLLSLFD